MAKLKQKVYVLGHKNPDTDSICSALAYAYLKNQIDVKRYIAKRAGNINQETRFVLDYFDVEGPSKLRQVKPQMKDIDIRHLDGVSRDMSLKAAWNCMNEWDAVTLPIVGTNGDLEGLITIGDIAKSYMAVYDSSILSRARTKFRNIILTLDGDMLVGNEHAFFTKGKVLIAAASQEIMEQQIMVDDLVILGNRFDLQKCSIQMGASCIVVCDGAEVSQEIISMAREKDCVLISTPHDTFTVARLLNQSMPIKYFMRKENIITFDTEDLVDTVKEIMSSVRHRDFPVLDMEGRYLGMVSRRNLLKMRRKQMILVDHNEKAQAVDGIEDTDILEIIDHHRLGALETIAPVYFRNQPVGCTATIVYQMFIEKKVEIPNHIAGLLLSAILSDTLMFRSPTCTSVDEEAAHVLAAQCQINIREYAGKMFKAGSDLSAKSAKEIFFQDFKKTSVGDITFGVGQVSALEQDELKECKEKIVNYLEETFSNHGTSYMFFMLTNIVEESTELLFFGDNAEAVVERAFHLKPEENNACLLEKVVSRKKQVIPALVIALQK